MTEKTPHVVMAAERGRVTSPASHDKGDPNTPLLSGETIPELERAADHAEEVGLDQVSAAGSSDRGEPGSRVLVNENLLGNARAHWQLGDWESLASIAREDLQHHPDRARLALFVAAGYQQLGHIDETRRMVCLAVEWGCDRMLIRRALVSGLYNSLGCAACLAKKQDKAKLSFEKALTLGVSSADSAVLKTARLNQQLKRLQIPAFGSGVSSMTVSDPPDKGRDSSAQPASDDVDLFDVPDDVRKAFIAGRWAYLTKLDNADVVTKENKGLLIAYAALGYQQLDDQTNVDRCTRLTLEWGLPRDAIKRVLGSGIRNTLAIAQVLSDDFKAASENFVASLKLDHREPKPFDVLSRIRQQLKNVKEIDQEKCVEELSKYIQQLDVTKNQKGEV